jgi:cold shock CspA family protein
LDLGIAEARAEAGVRRGVVRKLLPGESKGVGFLTPADGHRDIFFSLFCVEDAADIAVGDQVEFKATETDKGLRATWVRRIG